MAAGRLSRLPAFSGSSMSGGGGISGGATAAGGRKTGGGGTYARGGCDFWNQQDVLPNDNARMRGSSRDLAMVY
jgi:hypothetical protein